MAANLKNKPGSTSREINLGEVISITLGRWYWIVISLIVCMGLAIGYILKTQPLYTRTASIVIKSDSQNGTSVSSELEQFSNLGLIQTKSNITDEVNKLKSADVLTQVVRQTGLDIDYYRDGRFHPEIVYGSQLPVKVTFPNSLESSSINVDVDLTKPGKYRLTALSYNGTEMETPKQYTELGDTLATRAGAIVVEKTPYYDSSAIPVLHVDKIPLNWAVSRYTAELTIGIKEDKGNTIDISATDCSTERAEDLINGLISVYNERWIENRNQISVSTSRFINDRLGVIESELGNVDEDISSYQSAHLIPDVQQAASMYMVENQSTTSKLSDLNTQLQLMRYQRNHVASEAARNQMLPTNSGIDIPGLDQRIAEYNETMMQRNQYADNSSESHPKVIDLDTKLASMRSAIISALDNQITALNSQIKSQRESKSRTTAQIAANPNQAKYLLSVERQQRVKESLYLFLLQKREENELSQAFTAYNTEVIESPNGSDAPISPQKSKILMIAFVIGLVLPFAFTVTQEMFNTKVLSKKDLEALTVPILGEIPEYKSKKNAGKTANKVMVSSGNRNVINEAFRVLRTNVGFVSSGAQNTTIMVTSFNPGSGKTFLAVNLGISFALKGKKVLIIDCDMRRCTASSYVDTPKQGLSNYLVGEVDDINSVIVAGTLENNLSVLPVGTVPPNPTELLETERFAQLIKDLRDDYDYIFIDCPPIGMMADAQIIEGMVDRTIFVVRAGLFERDMLPQLQQYADTKKIKNMGIVLNGISSTKSRYGYGYGYNYGYGYSSYSSYSQKD